jgi:hypothetical protein
MRPLFVILLSLLSLVSSAGFTGYSHLCKSSAVQRFSLTDSGGTDRPCPVCALKERGLEQKKKNCCQHEKVIIKTGDAVKKTPGSHPVPGGWGDAIPNRTLGAVFDNLPESLSSHFPHPSFAPLSRNTPLYILHCIYRI